MTIDQAFNKFKSDLELSRSFQEAVTVHHSAVREWVESFDSSIDTKLIGSLQRKTRIQPRPGYSFDIDILVILGSFKRWVNDGTGITPDIALNQLEHIVKAHGRYKKLGPESDSPTVMFEYSDGVVVELVPAYRDQIGEISPRGRGYYVPKNNRWILADYDYDAEYITRQNENSRGYLIPTIKMLKAAKRKHFPQMKSYHLEVMAAEIVPGIVSSLDEQNIGISYPMITWLFFTWAQNYILEESRIPGSKSPPADEYMSSRDKNELSRLFGAISGLCSKTFGVDDSSAIKEWFKIFGEPFPKGG